MIQTIYKADSDWREWKISINDWDDNFIYPGLLKEEDGHLYYIDLETIKEFSSDLDDDYTEMEFKKVFEGNSILWERTTPTIGELKYVAALEDKYEEVTRQIHQLGDLREEITRKIQELKFNKKCIREKLGTAGMTKKQAVEILIEAGILNEDGSQKENIVDNF